MEKLKMFWRAVREFINTVNITNFKILGVVGLAYLTALKILFLQDLGPALIGEPLIVWCTFLGSLAGVATWQYRIKRNTAQEMNTPPPEGEAGGDE